jgi:hypothetical protein
VVDLDPGAVAPPRQLPAGVRVAQPRLVDAALGAPAQLDVVHLLEQDVLPGVAAVVPEPGRVVVGPLLAEDAAAGMAVPLVPRVVRSRRGHRDLVEESADAVANRVVQRVGRDGASTRRREQAGEDHQPDQC